MIDTFSALSNTNRLRMVLILERGPLNVSEICRVLRISQSNASHHLRILLDAGVLLRTMGGGWAFYRLNRADAFMCSLIRCITAARDGVDSYARDMEELGRCYQARRIESREFFDSVAEEWDARSSPATDPEASLDFILRTLPPEGTVLDAGCGSGALLARLCGTGLRLIGVDHSGEMLRRAGARLSGIAGGDDVELRLGSAEHLPVADSSLEGVIAHMVLHHLGEPRLFLAEAARVLRPGGVCILVELVPHEDAKLMETHGDLWPGLEQEEVAGWMASAGFVLDESAPPGGSGSYWITGRRPQRNGKEDRG